MDRLAIQRRRRKLLLVVGAVVGLAAVVLLIFGSRWRQTVILRALASPQEAKVAWAKRRLERRPDKGVTFVLAHLGRRDKMFDLQAADYLEEIGAGNRLPTELRVRAALAKLHDPLLASIGLARLVELSPDALGPLLQQAGTLEGPVLRRAAFAATRIDAEESNDRARHLIADVAPQNRRLALALYAALDDAEVPAIRGALDDPEPGVRSEAVYALVHIQEHDCLAAVEPLLADPDRGVRLEVIQAFAAVGTPADGARLLPALSDVDEEVRAQAVLVLADLGAQEHLPALFGCVSDPSAQVRTAVAAALGTLSGEESVDMLIRLSRDDSARVRAAAATSLAKFLGNERVLPALRRCAEDDSPEVLRAVYRALAESGRPEVIPFFVGQLTDERPSWATDPLPPERAGARAERVPRGAMAACALRWLTGKEFGYHWRASAEEHRLVQEQWERWLAEEGRYVDPTTVKRPEGLKSYEQLLRRIAHGR